MKRTCSYTPFVQELFYFIKKFIILFLTLFFFSCQKESELTKTLFVKVPVTKSGVDFENRLKPTDSLNILDYLYFYNGAGVAIGDINQDGLQDLFVVSNQGDNRLYLNKGNWRFEDITEKAGVEGNSDWNTGANFADVNGDGLLDIYVCAVSGIQGLRGRNELFINNGDLTFTESAAKFNLDYENYSTSAAFFDYDLDGDLDLYLLNHAIHTQNSFGRASIRNTRNEKSGDKLLRNDGGSFTDVSEVAGIYGGANGYGLGIATADFNQDGYVDLYVSNDFHEDDYYYVNNGDGTFNERGKEFLGHTSRFSMGSDVADINKDGFPDLITLDMTPEDEKVLKSSAGDETLEMLQMRVNRLGYSYQFARNMLQINQNGKSFSEQGLLYGVEATDWSWSALFGDYDQDGNKDLFISNGIPKRPNDLDYIKYLSNEEIQKKMNSNNDLDTDILQKMPAGKVKNYMFKGKKRFFFEEISDSWLPDEKTASNGAAYADLDNDGDLDLIINHLDQTLGLYENKTDSTANYLKIHFRYKDKNRLGIGTKVFLYTKTGLQYQQLFTSKGFQSSSEALLHFGLGDLKTIDSLKIIWPDHTYQVAEKVASNQSLLIKPLYDRDSVRYPLIPYAYKAQVKKVELPAGLDYEHKENLYNDQSRHKLIPFHISDKGPVTLIFDVNKDGKDDIFFGNAKSKPSEIYIQKEKGFIRSFEDSLKSYKMSEEVDGVLADLNSDGKQELITALAGGEYANGSKNLINKIYTFDQNQIHIKNFTGPGTQTSVIVTEDVDQDGDMDIFIGAYANASSYGKIETSYLYTNENGTFTANARQEFPELGMITDAVFEDFNQDGWQDLIVIGEWMSPRFFMNKEGIFTDVTTSYLSEKPLHGLWQKILPYDIDQDGDMDYLLGNMGLNTKWNASIAYPLRMYYHDFDQNNQAETILAQATNEVYYPLASLDELAMQLTFLRKKFTNYKDFAGKPITNIFDSQSLQSAKLFEVHQLASGYLENKDGSFEFVPFSAALQVAPLRNMLRLDLMDDEKDEVLLTGNYFGIAPYHGRFDAFSGAVLKSASEIVNAMDLGFELNHKMIAGLNEIEIGGKRYILVTVHNSEPELYEIL